MDLGTGRGRDLKRERFGLYVECQSVIKIYEDVGVILVLLCKVGTYRKRKWPGRKVFVVCLFYLMSINIPLLHSPSPFI